MDKCVFAFRVVDPKTGEVLYWSINKGQWCRDCKGITVKQLTNLLILMNQIEERGNDETK